MRKTISTTSAAIKLARSCLISPCSTDIAFANVATRSPKVSSVDKVSDSGCSSTAEAAADTTASLPAPSKGGRRHGPIWQHFRALDGRTHPRVECMHCSACLNSAIPKRNMVPHALESPGVLPMDKRFLRSAYKIPVPVQPTAGQQQIERAGDTSSTDQSTPFGQVEFELLLARVFFCCALPFALIDAPVFRRLFTMVAPRFRLPSKARLVGQLLVEVKEACKAEVIETINRQGTASIVSDGWTDGNGCSIVNFMVAAPGMPSIFWSSLATGAAKPTAEFMAKELERVINEVQMETTAIVSGVLTDSTEHMSSAWELLQERPPLFGGGCAAHVLNLLIEDIFTTIDFIKLVKEQALAVARFVREHHVLLDQFRHLQRTQISADQVRRALVIPVPTRWSTTHSCLRSVLKNRVIIEEIFQSSHCATLLERCKMPATVLANLQTVKAIVASQAFWQNLAFAVAMIDPIIEALRELESGGVPTSRVYARFKWLREGYTDAASSSTTCSVSERRSGLFGLVLDDRGRPYHGIARSVRQRVRAAFRELVDSRWKFVHTDAMEIAYLLDPNTDPTGFINADEADTIDQAFEFARRTKMLSRLGITYEQLNGSLYAFANRKRHWTATDRLKNAGVAPRHWWKSHRGDEVGYEALFQLAELVFSIPTSSASSERAWSISDYIHTKKRNRLSRTKVEMLAYIYINSDLHSNGKLDLARLQTHPEADVEDIEVSNDVDTLMGLHGFRLLCDACGDQGFAATFKVNTSSHSSLRCAKSE